MLFPFRLKRPGIAQEKEQVCTRLFPVTCNSEEQHQRAIVEWLRWTKPNCVWFFVNNGARLSKAQAGIAKAMGVLPGVADLVFVLPGGRVGFIELKAPGRDSIAESTASSKSGKSFAVR